MIIKVISEIEIENQAMSNTNFYKKNIIHSNKIIVNNLLLDLIYEIGDWQKIANSLKGYGVDFNTERYCVSYLKINQFTLPSNLTNNIDRITRDIQMLSDKLSIIDGVTLVKPYSERNNLILIIEVKCNEDYCNGYVSSKINVVKQNLDNFPSITINIGIGECVTRIPDISRSYAEAKEALEYSFFEECNSIVQYKNIIPLKEYYNIHKYDMNLKIVNISKNIILDIRAIKLDSTLKNVENLFETITLYKGVSISALNILFDRVLTDIFTAVAEIDKKAITKNEELIKQKILKTNNIFELKAIFEVFIKETINSLKLSINKDEKIIQKVLDIIEHEYMEGLSLGNIADRIYLSSNYLGQVFIKITGKTFNNYLNEFRMQKAKELLKNTHYSISVIAQKTGIGDVTYFCRLYKNCFGISPGKYRSETVLKKNDSPD